MCRRLQSFGSKLGKARTWIESEIFGCTTTPVGAPPGYRFFRWEAALVHFPPMLTTLRLAGVERCCCTLASASRFCSSLTMAYRRNMESLLLDLVATIVDYRWLQLSCLISTKRSGRSTGSFKDSSFWRMEHGSIGCGRARTYAGCSGRVFGGCVCEPVDGPFTNP
jgi:hypothetical protein